ncbi:hypothetical protein A0H81_07385 [Grifola frondosa]|uniref:Uncharacterized protein n=1 Tax=Grifola frondosa TaxID=5627 RepID=A0A1C7M802_GRIFR|nr:hypothetical protein A0H81_07385 [Grifola frondosa]
MNTLPDPTSPHLGLPSIEHPIIPEFLGSTSTKSRTVTVSSSKSFTRIDLCWPSDYSDRRSQTHLRLELAKF